MEKDPYKRENKHSEYFIRIRKIRKAGQEFYWEMYEEERRTAAGSVDAVLSGAGERPHVGPEGRISTMKGFYPEDDPHF